MTHSFLLLQQVPAASKHLRGQFLKNIVHREVCPSARLGWEGDAGQLEVVSLVL